MIMHVEVYVFHPCFQSVKVVVGALMLLLDPIQVVQDFILKKLNIINVGYQFILILIALFLHDVNIHLNIVIFESIGVHESAPIMRKSTTSAGPVRGIRAMFRRLLGRLLRNCFGRLFGSVRKLSGGS